MVKNYNSDPRPKRRRDMDNPYTIFTQGSRNEGPYFFIAFRDARGEDVCLDVGQSMYELFDRFERDDLSHMNKSERYHERSVLSEEEITRRAFYPQEDVFDIVYRKLRREMLYEAINKLTKTQQRRLLLYFFGGFTYEEIAQIEGCRHSAVARTVKSALRKLRKYLSEFFDEI